jgi:subtilase family serine protease
LSSSYPASDPLVTALGGTALTADAATGQYLGETAWNEPIFNAAGGGGYSTLFARPNYQSGVTGDPSGRAVPDLALNASVDGGVLIYQAHPLSGKEYAYITGGTSVSAPEFAGIGRG